MRNFNRNDRSSSRRNFGGRDFAKKSFSGERYGNGDREMFGAICGDCGRNCEVPFKPTGSKPVYCNDCFKKNNGGERDFSRRFQERSPRRPDFERSNESRPQNNEQFDAINRKLNKILDLLSALPKKQEEKVIEKPVEVIAEIEPKKTKVSKKKTPETK